MANWFPVGKEGANTVYAQKDVCEAQEGHACYDITGKDVRYHVIQPVQVGVDELGAPVYEPQLVEDPDLKAQVEAADAAEAAQDMAISEKMANMHFGQKVLALIAVRNDAKSLQPADIVSLTTAYATIQSLLLSGSIATAKAQIEAITPDGTLVTQADKDSILAAINDYLGV
jgi:hypothetical protein